MTRQWPLAAALLLVMLAIVWIDGSRPAAFPDIVAVRCAGEALNAGMDPYTSVRAICGPQTLDFFYPPVVARLAAVTVAWWGTSAWMAVFKVAYAASFATLIGVAVRLLTRTQRAAAAPLAGIALLFAFGGGVAVTGFQSGNIAVLFWAALAVAVFELRSARACALVILVGGCIKIYLLYLLVIPVLMRKDLRLALLAGGVAVLAYVTQWYFEPALFASYSHEVRELSHTPGYAGASSMQLGVWVAALTGIPAMRLIVAAVVAGLLLWRSSHLVKVLLRGGDHDDTARLRLLILLLLALAVLSPRVTHYDLLILLPVVALLITLRTQRIALIVGCIAIPWLCRVVLLAAHFDPLKSSLQAKYGLDYNTLWELYLFATWAAVTGYAWYALGRNSVDAMVTVRPGVA